jgi:hypothetical protein
VTLGGPLHAVASGRTRVMPGETATVWLSRESGSKTTTLMPAWKREESGF